MHCDENATWERATQFAGNHPYCEVHAMMEEDFGESDSYSYWIDLKEESNKDVG
jgi:hypothetical protein